jgi:uncharacterized membrane protein YfcA
MSVDTQTVWAAAIMFAAALTRSTFGFGEALVAMPLLALVFDDVRIATALVAISSVFNGILILTTCREGTDWRGAWRLIIGCLLGTPIGVYVLIHVPESIVKVLLAGVLVAFSVYSLYRPRTWHLERDDWAYPFGFAAGLLGGAYNTSGPALVIFGSLRGWTPTQFRSTLQGVFLPNAAFILLMHYSAGLWSSNVFHYLKWSLPGVVLSVPIGYWLNRRIHPQHFQRVLYALLLILAGMLLWSTFRK